MNKKLFLYVKAFSELGTMMDMIVMNALILAMTHSPAWLSANLAIRVIGGVLSSMFSGVLADRYDRKKIMIWSDIVRALAIILLILFPNPFMFLTVSFVLGIFASSFQICFSAEIPQIFGENKVLEVNALISRLTSISIVIGFFTAGFFSDFLGYNTVLAIDSFSYMVSALVLYKMNWKTAVRAVAIKVSPLKSLLGDAREVKKYLALHPLLWILFLTWLVQTFGASSHNVGIPLLASQLNEEKAALYQGLIWGVWGMGAVLITALLPRLSWVKERYILSYFVCLIGMSLCFITFLSQEQLLFILPVAFLTGIFDSAASTLFSTVLQGTENSIRGRIFGVSQMANRLGFSMGFLIVPLLLKQMSMPHMVWILHGTSILCASGAILAILFSSNLKKHLQSSVSQ